MYDMDSLFNRDDFPHVDPNNLPDAPRSVIDDLCQRRLAAGREGRFDVVADLDGMIIVGLRKYGSPPCDNAMLVNNPPGESNFVAAGPAEPEPNPLLANIPVY